MNQLIGYIKASNPDKDDQFGYSVALSGDGNTLAVGAPGEYGEDGSGAVYVYRRENGV